MSRTHGVVQRDEQAAIVAAETFSFIETTSDNGHEPILLNHQIKSKRKKFVSFTDVKPANEASASGSNRSNDEIVDGWFNDAKRKSTGHGKEIRSKYRKFKRTVVVDDNDEESDGDKGIQDVFSTV